MTKEHENLVSCVADYATAAHRVLDAILDWEAANANLDYGTLFDAFPHDESMEDVVNRIMTWRDSLRGEV